MITEHDEVPEQPTLPEPPLIQRDRSRRRPLVPRGLILAAFAVIALVSAAVWIGTWYVTGLAVEVPDVTSVPEGVARTRLAQAGLSVSTVERRFDVEPPGTVLSQAPPGGTRLSRGDSVALVVSAGTEEFVMPDVIGQGINVARAQLEQRGLVVRIEAVDSPEAPDTVLETIPAPGTTVRTSDIVRIRIASEGGVSSALLPFSLQGALFVLDPAPAPDQDVDVPLEVARRLRSLLEASGARVVVTRSIADTEVDLATRARRVAEATPTVTALVGLDVSESGAGGITVLVPEASTVPDVQRQRSSDLADAMLVSLGDSESRVRRSELASDPVIAATTAPAVRLMLGSLDDREDVAAFRDPTWSDVIARTLYRALGESITR